MYGMVNVFNKRIVPDVFSDLNASFERNNGQVISAAKRNVNNNSVCVPHTVTINS